MEDFRAPRTGSPFRGPGCPHHHLVEFYETEAFLVDSVARFLAPALATRGAAVVVATDEHRDAFAGALARDGHDVAGLRADGRLVLLDAAELLGSFMVDGAPDAGLFRRAVLPVLDGAAAAGDGPVLVYGEMVALLWADGDAASAIRLEDHWNALAAIRDFDLLCAYPMAGFGSPADVAAFRRICDQHSVVVPAESYTSLPDETARGRMVSRLQQEVAALRRDLVDLRDQRAELAELAYVEPLTGLANRRAFDRDLVREWGLARRGDVDSQIVLADLDGFKLINDDLGHLVGDEFLRRFGAGLREEARETDVVARIGGDEFAVLLLRCDEATALAFLARVGRRTGAIEVEGRSLSCALGHASLRGSPSPADALARADAAMFARKPHLPRGGGALRGSGPRA